MKFCIDQSGKVEQTNKNTVVCLANGNWDTVLIKSKTKRQIQEIWRRNGQIRNYVIFTFCALLSLLIKRNLKLKSVVIDKEYFGKEPIIKNILEEMLKRQKNSVYINFSLIGRGVQAHSKGYLTYSNKLKPKHVANLHEVFKEIKKTEVGKRLKEA